MSDIDGGKVVSTWETEEEHGSVPMYLLGVEKHQKLIGWKLEKGNPDGALVAFPYPIERETRFYPVVRDAKWVTFDTLGGMPLTPAGVIQGERIDAPVPVRSGYTFLGWYDEQGEPVPMLCVVWQDMRLTARWEANTDTPYCVVHLLENAEDSAYSSNEEIAPTQRMTGTTGRLTRARAYDLSAQGFTVQQVEQSPIAGDGSTIVTIRYSRNVYQVRFYSAKSASAPLIDWLTITAKHGANIEMRWPSIRYPDVFPTAWNVSPSGNVYQTCLSTMPVGGKSFWQISQSGRYAFAINYYLETLPGEAGTVAYQGRSLRLHKTDQWRNADTAIHSTPEDHYDIAGFTYLENVAYDNAKAPFLRDDLTHYHIDFYYARNTYSLRFYNAVGFERTRRVPYQQSLAGMEYVPQRPDVSTVVRDAVFTGWYTTELCLPGTEADFSQLMTDHDVILYAGWQPPSYRVRVYLDRQGTLPYAAADWRIRSGRTIGNEGFEMPGIDELVPPEAESRPEDFLGWEYQTEDGTRQLFHFDMNITGNLELFPRWKTGQAYRVTYRAGEWGSGEAPVDGEGYAYGARAPLLGPGTMTGRDGRVFTGWLSSADGQIHQPYSSVSVTRDVVLTAQWAAPLGPALLTYHANDGSGSIETQTTPNNGLVTVKANPFLSQGKRFTGWNTRPDGSGQAFAPGGRARVTLREANDLYAQWAPAWYTVTSAVTGGRIDSQGDTQVTYQGSLTVRYAPDEGYELVSAVVDGVDVTATCPSAYRFEGVEADHRIDVVYRPMVRNVKVMYYRDAAEERNLLGTHTASARVGERFRVPAGNAPGQLNALRPAAGYLDGVSTPEAIVVSEDPDSNVLRVVYARRSDIRYTVRHLEWGTGLMLAQDAVHAGTFGQRVRAGAYVMAVPGYAHHSCDPADGLTLEEEGGLLTLYYRPELVDCTVEYYYGGVLDDTRTYAGRALPGTVISDYPDGSRTGYRFLSDTCPLTADRDAGKNRIRVCYEAEEPVPPTSEPDGPVPEPDKPTPEPGKPTPEPDKPTPEPDKPTPEPGKPTPEPGKPTPEPGKPTPEPGKPTPEPGRPVRPGLAPAGGKAVRLEPWEAGAMSSVRTLGDTVE